MIVICTKCQAKFRVADEKIGPRGARVRCSRCQTVFPVQRDLAGEPAWAGAAPLAAAPAPAAPPAPPPMSDGVAPDDPFASAPPDPSTDPFGGIDPFAGADPFAADAVSAPAPPSPLPVTDLSDLLGPPAPAAAARPRAVPPPLPPAAGQGAAPVEASQGEPPWSADDGGLSLEDRLTPPPVKLPSLAEPSLELGDAPARAARRGTVALLDDPFAAAARETFEPGAFDDPPAWDKASLELGGDAPGSAPRAARAPSSNDALAPSGETPSASSPARSASTAALRVPGEGLSRVRAIAVNAIALVALLAIAVAILVVWRTGGALDAGVFRPSALLAALGANAAAQGPFAAQEVQSGLYERERGPPLLFVRGKAVSRAAATVPAVVVSVEVVRDGAVLARGEAIAGAVPTPEELYGAADAAALERVARAARARAPGEVRPGDALPFLIAIADAPADLDGAEVRVSVAPARNRAP